MYESQYLSTVGHIPDDVTVAEWLFANRTKNGLTTAFVDGATGEERTWQQVEHRTRQLASGLADLLKITVGPNVPAFGLFAPNMIDVPCAIWASHLMGGVVTGMNPAYTASEVAHQMITTQAVCLFTVAALLPVVREACPAAVIVLLEGRAPGCHSVHDLVTRGAALPALPKVRLAAGEAKTRLAFLSFSSGTTGKPKGVMISHYNIIANILQNTMFVGCDVRNGQAQRTVSLGLLPFYHIYGLSVILHSEMYMGNTLVLLPSFDLAKFLDIVAQHHIAKLFLVPPIVVRLTKDPSIKKRGKPLAHVTEIFCGAAPLSAAMMADMRGLIAPNACFRQGYGLTETSPSCCVTHEDDQWDGSIGVCMPDVTMKLMSSDGKEVAGYDAPGELWVKGPMVTLGYYQNEAATRECFHRDTDGAVWLATGDEAVVRQSPGGKQHFFIVDRLKELIKVKGLQVAPAELEAALLEHDAVADAAVIGIEAEREGELPYAFIVLHPGHGKTKQMKDTLAQHIEATKAKFKWLKGGIEFMDTIPKSASGKILRKDLRVLYKSRAKL